MSWSEWFSSMRDYKLPENSLYVFVNGYGLRPFRIIEKSQLYPDGRAQFKGQYKLPKGSKTTAGKKWIDLDYWFTEDQLFESKSSALSCV